MGNPTTDMTGAVLIIGTVIFIIAVFWFFGKLDDIEYRD